MLGAPDIGGRFFYNDDLTGFNFKPVRIKLDAVLDEIARQSRVGDAAGDLRRLDRQSTRACRAFAPRTISHSGDRQPLVSIWLGNRTRIAAHHDLPDNIACVVAGRRRFTLFPPEQLENLYIGPLDFTPAGQAISLVDFAQPDFDEIPEVRRRRCSTRRSPSSARAMRSSFPACGGITSSRSTPSTCW